MGKTLMDGRCIFYCITHEGLMRGGKLSKGRHVLLLGKIATASTSRQSDFLVYYYLVIRGTYYYR